MTYKKKSWILLLVFSLSFFPLGRGQAEDPDRTFQEARSLLYLGDAFLEDEANLDTAARFPGLLTPVPGIRGAEVAEEVMSRMIHATKQERNDLDANCRLLNQRFQSAGDQTAVQKLESYCQSERKMLTNRISLLRRLRGDRRKMFTRLWHSLKRDAGNLWRRIGPVGRIILRRVGDEAFEVVASGGTLSGGGIKRLLKQAVKDTAREELKRTAVQGMERLLQSQVKIARASGVLEENDEGDAPQFLDGDTGQSDTDVPSDDEAAESLNDSSSAQDTYQMTPEEESNAGKHSYSWEVYLLGEYENSGTQIAEHEFTDTGVLYRFFSENNQETFSVELMRVGPNEYATEDGRIENLYKMTGYESSLSSGHFYIFTLDE